MANRKFQFAALTALAMLTQGMPGFGQHRYQVAVSASLDALTVTARPGPAVSRLQAAGRGAARLLDGAETCDGEPLKRRDRTLYLPAGTRCVRYRFDLAAARSESRRGWPETVAVAAPADWLWLPAPRNGEAQVQFQMAPGHSVSVPWTPAGSGFLVRGDSGGGGSAVSLFGRFDDREIVVPGARLRVARIPGERESLNEADMIRWLGDAAHGVARVHGQFPHPHPQVVLIPSGPASREGDSPVPFGRVVRDGGVSVHFFVSTGRPLDDYLSDWTAIHEFSHLLVPSIRDRWLAEGLASYYQNVLMVRAGHYSPEIGWSRLHAGIERARAIQPPVSPVDTAGRRVMGRHRMMIYWSGAALLLKGDVALREKSGGEESLDVLLGRLYRCCLPAQRSWRGKELFARLDEVSSYTVFEDLYQRHASRPGVVPVDDLYRRLGLVVVDHQTLRLGASGPLLAVRDAIMSPGADVLERRSGVADSGTSSQD